MPFKVKRTFKGATKRCVYVGCKSDSRFQRPTEKYGFIRFQQPCLMYRKGWNTTDEHVQQCQVCIKSQECVRFCKRTDGRFQSLLHVTKDKYICTLHTDGNNSPFLVRKVTAVNFDHEQNKQVECQQIESLILDETGRSDIGSNLFDQSNSTEKNKLIQEQQCTGTSPDESIVKKSVQSRKCQTDMKLVNVNRLQLKLHQRNVELMRLQRENLLLKQRKRKSALSVFLSNLARNPVECFYYTGLRWAQLTILYKFLAPDEQKLHYWYSKYYHEDEKKPVKEKRRHFTYWEECILTLVRLRGGLLMADMCYRFRIPRSTLSRIIITWIQFMYFEFKEIQSEMFASRTTINELLPAMFNRLKNIRVILDCAEFFCEVPGNFEHQGNVYSNYKHHTTHKVLLGSTPNGVLSFVSDVFEGAISDKEIVQQSGIINFLEEGDLVLADRGFTITDILDNVGVKLNIPPFLKGRDRLTPQEEIETKQIAKERIYVEHIVGRLKNFRILQRIIPHNMRGIISQLVYVCACLINFQPPILTE